MENNDDKSIAMTRKEVEDLIRHPAHAHMPEIEAAGELLATANQQTELPPGPALNNQERQQQVQVLRQNMGQLDNEINENADTEDMMGLMEDDNGMELMGA